MLELRALEPRHVGLRADAHEARTRHGICAVRDGSCVVLYVASVLVDFRPALDIFGIFSPTAEGLFVFGGSGQGPVLLYGRWWTVLAASWLHVNLIHILVNMMSLRNVAPIVSEFY